jgi:hypothetical protein
VFEGLVEINEDEIDGISSLDVVDMIGVLRKM